VSRSRDPLCYKKGSHKTEDRDRGHERHRQVQVTEQMACVHSTGTGEDSTSAGHKGYQCHRRLKMHRTSVYRLLAAEIAAAPAMAPFPFYAWRACMGRAPNGAHAWTNSGKGVRPNRTECYRP
jgi:hypothetical protein